MTIERKAAQTYSPHKLRYSQSKEVKRNERQCGFALHDPLKDLARYSFSRLVFVALHEIYLFLDPTILSAHSKFVCA
jgi:hypothetical protein